MASNHLVPLSEVCESIDYGLTASAKDHPTSYKFLRITDIVSGHLDWGTVPYVDPSDAKLDRYTLHHGDIVVARTGATTGHSAYIRHPPPCLFASYLVRLKVRTGVDARYVAYTLKAPAFADFIRAVTGDKSAQPNASATTMTKALIRLPPLHEQQAIASILGALDDKIELNRRMNQTLEEMAQAIFKSWFVDFEGHTEFEESELGRIPKGWALRSLYESATFINGAAYRDFHFCPPDEGWPVVKIAELKAGITAQTRFTNTVLAEKYRIDNDAILFSWSGNPDTSIDTFIWTRGPAWLNQHIFRVCPHRPVERTFVYLHLRHLRPTFAEIARNKQTTGLGHVTAGDMKRLPTVLPPDEVLLDFNAAADPLFERYTGNLYENQTLTEIRDTLLPKLISGEIRIPEAEKLVENVA